ncbi:LuxR C-terminal-related transcriptional regulator [Streptomyces sp. NPDC051907]|uniref:response regulator transcription factor n=1 Tax=Streptomyces sp. NPDC051907 TaxID=3155284 RepID=UPI0034369A1F
MPAATAHTRPRPPAVRRPQRVRRPALPREEQFAEHLSTGATNKEIAQALRLSTRTVEHHVANTLRRLHVHSREDVKDALDSTSAEP